MKKLLFMLLFGAACNAQITIGTPNNLVACDPDNNGLELFDLTQNSTLLLGSLDPTLYTVTYHLSEVDAESGVPSINNSDNYNSVSMFIYARVTENQDNSNYVVAPFSLIVVSIPNFTISGGPVCTDFITSESQPAILDTGLSTDDYNFSWTYNGMPIGTNEGMLSTTMLGTYEVTAISLVGGCSYTRIASVILSGPASPIGIGYIVNGQDITITVEGYGNYRFQLDNGTMQQSNVFTNVSLGMHTVQVQDLGGCGTLQISFSIPPAPTGETEQSFTPGQTLADLNVEGENIQWYDGMGPDSTLATPLPLTTVLVDGTTYYASQTINGVESEDYLAVTVHSTMAVAEQSLSTLRYYPNPVNNVLNLSNTDVIDTVNVYNVMGQVILTKNTGSNSAELDLSALQSGIYILKVSSSGQQKTIKIQKQ
jgi:hypothetical protein